MSRRTSQYLIDICATFQTSSASCEKIYFNKSYQNSIKKASWSDKFGQPLEKERTGKIDEIWVQFVEILVTFIKISYYWILLIVYN